jgi:hypothetical protein
MRRSVLGQLGRSLFLPDIELARSSRNARVADVFWIFGRPFAVIFENHPDIGQITGRRVRIRLRTPPSSLPKPRKPSSIGNRPFLRGSCHLFSTFPVSAENNGLSGGFLPPVSASKNSVPRELNLGRQLTSRRSGIRSAEKRISSGVRTYCGFNPSASRLCLSEIKFAHTDDEVRQEMA